MRLTLAFAGGMALILAAVGAYVYVRMGANLLAANDAGLRSRAEVIVADVRARGPELADVGTSLIESDEAFAQIADAAGRILQSSPIVSRTPMLGPGTVARISRPALFDRRIAGIDDVTRVLAVPVVASGRHLVVLVGSSLQDRRDELLQLAATLAIGGPVALLLISLAGWVLAGAALRPMERMRREAATISTSDPARRLPVPDRNDEVAKLGVTLNRMLDRIQSSVERERRLVDNAAHELRTPLAILKTELDLALSRARSRDELETALMSASDEADHLVRLAEDLLVLSRAHGGTLPVVPVETSLAELLEEARGRHSARARTAGIVLEVVAPDARVRVDSMRLRQAVDDLLDNALEHAPKGGHVRLVAERGDGKVSISVQDDGPGFPEGFLPHAFEPFARARSGGDGAGLGLAIVRAIAEAHGGSAAAENVPEGGAKVTVIVRCSPAK